MKKLVALVAVVVLFGGAVFAQPVPQKDLQGIKVDHASIHRQALAARQESRQTFINRALALSPVDLSYELTTSVNPQCQMVSVSGCKNTKAYPKNGTFSGRVMQTEEASYVVISDEVWNVIDDMSSLSWISQTYGGQRVVKQAFKTTNGEEYSQDGQKLTVSHYTVRGNKYAVIAFPVTNDK